MHDKRGRRRKAGRAAMAAALLGWLTAPAAAQLQQAIKQRAEANQAATQSQDRIDKLSEQTDDLAREYRSALQETDSLRVYNRHLEELVSSQEKERASLRAQIDGITVIGREVTPLMLRMIDTLDQFVRLDLPFLLEERQQRVQHLRELMARADVSDSEKYRRILEAYQIENEYGRTIEAYQGTIGRGDQARTVDFLRVGRVALLYQTLDAREQAAWDSAHKTWVPLGREYRNEIKQGLRIARKQAAPDLIRLPLPAAEAAK